MATRGEGISLRRDFIDAARRELGQRAPRVSPLHAREAAERRAEEAIDEMNAALGGTHLRVDADAVRERLGLAGERSLDPYGGAG